MNEVWKSLNEFERERKRVRVWENGRDCMRLCMFARAGEAGEKDRGVPAFLENGMRERERVSERERWR